LKISTILQIIELVWKTANVLQIYVSPITPYILPLVKSIEQWGQQVLEVLKQLGDKSSLQNIYSWVGDPLANPFMEYVRH
jgi:hypothetical protein